MLLDSLTWALAHRIDSVLPRLPHGRTTSFTAETHGSALEIQTTVHDSIGSAVEELGALRTELDETLKPLSMRAASAGTHPFAVWQEIVVSAGERYQFVYGSMRELARREPTFGLHVHVGVPDAETGDPRRQPPAHRAPAAARPLGQLALLAGAGHRPRLGADAALPGLPAGRHPARLPFLRGVRRVGRRPDPLRRGARADLPLVGRPPAAALRHDRGADHGRPDDPRRHRRRWRRWSSRLVRLEVEEGSKTYDCGIPPEVLAENRFLAARDGMDAELIAHELDERVPARALLEDLLILCRPHAEALGCAAELEAVPRLAERTGARRQLGAEAAPSAPSPASSPCLPTTFWPARRQQGTQASRHSRVKHARGAGSRRCRIALAGPPRVHFPRLGTPRE